MTGQYFLDEAVDLIDRHSGDLRILTPHGGFTVKDPVGVVRRVAARCQGGAFSDEVLADFDSVKEQRAAESALALLERRRVVHRQPRTSWRAADPLVGWLAHIAGSTISKPGRDRIQIVGEGAIATALRRQLQAFGFSVVEDGEDISTAVLVAACDQPDRNGLRRLNAQACREQRTFLPIWLERAVLHWGPMTSPQATGCIECLHHREEAARRRGPVEDDGHDIGLTVSSAAAELAAILASSELARWAHDAHVESDIGMVWRFDLLNLSFEGSRVLRLPRCPVCSIEAVR